ncbi:MAG: SpoIIE family protein phosphatase [Bacteroidales bacterium]|nr:SpoIIE family protein phosphatase [Bacteroidales bacterium]
MFLTNLIENIRPKRRIFLFSMMASFALAAYSQTYYFDNYNVREGLGQSKVYTIIQDKDDYIWLGTLSGASRFDGINFENFTSEQGMAPNAVRAIVQDEFGNIWFGHTGGGISRYKDGKFERIEAADSIYKSDIVVVFYDNNTGLWFTSDGSGALLCENPNAPADQITFKHFSGKNGLSDRTFQCGKFLNDSVYIITDYSIKKYEPSKGGFTNFALEGMPVYFQPTCFMQDSKKNIWLGTHNGGLYQYFDEEKKFIIYDWMRDGLAHNFISTLFEDKDGNIWIGTWGGGISRFSNNKFKNFTTKNGLQDEKIRCIMQDKEGNILIGTNDHGLSIFKGESFISFTESDGLINKHVWAINQDGKGNYWFGTDGGITVYNPQKDAQAHYTYYTQEKDYISNQIRFIRRDKDNNMWVGTEDLGIYYLKNDGNRLLYYTPVNRLFPSLMITTGLVVDSDNNLWIGTIDGLINFEIDNNQGGRLTQYYGIAGNDITALMLDKNETLWIGSKAKGVTICEKQGDQRVFTIIPALKDMTPTGFAEDKEGKIWIATEGRGVIVYDDDTIVKHLTVSDGLLANLINIINIDENNNVYIGTNKGLNKYDQKENKIYTYTLKNGFVGIETKKGATYIDNDGNLWFGTVNGVTKYSPQFERTEVTEPLTHITKMRVNLKDRPMVNGMKLNYKENSIIFDYHSICLTNPDAVQYMIMLEGADHEWQPITKQTMESYSALPPGKYSFKVKARNSVGMWNKEPVSFDFQIKPPFYKTWWFIITCIIIGVVGIVIFIKVRERQLIKEKRILEEKVKERTIEITRMNEELAMKNKDITDSIRYAKRIQFAMLSPDMPYKNAFILFKPKDIVSGDFYWMLEYKGLEYFAAVDCTGHGVPGAFMSIIGHNSLDKIVKEYGITQPGEILSQLNKEVTMTLHQQIEKSQIDAVKDGMDLSLTCYDPKKKTLQYAGAYNPLILIRNSEIIEIRGDKFAIGRSDENLDKKFTNHDMPVEEGDSIYIFSDGYADQFGGEKGKKFMIKPLKNLLVAIQEKNMEEQKDFLNHTIEAWKGEYEQVDDILIMGRRFVH